MGEAQTAYDGSPQILFNISGKHITIYHFMSEHTTGGLTKFYHQKSFKLE